MSEIEHYFENLIHDGKDVSSNENKDFLSKEVQEAVEECALYIRSLLGLGIITYTDWIPTSERLPENTDPVNITWVNRNPESYYAKIKDVPFTATGHYFKGKWYWYSAACQDILEEYGRCPMNEIDDAIEIAAWMPLPESYKVQPSGVMPITI